LSALINPKPVIRTMKEAN